MNIVTILEQDYQKFPLDQNYNIYAQDVYFQDPLNKFRGIDQYQKMIKNLTKFFDNIKMDLHHIEQDQSLIKTEWTLKMKFSLLPWKPLLKISGRSELILNQDDLIISHQDYWNISRLAVLKQVFIQSK